MNKCRNRPICKSMVEGWGYCESCKELIRVIARVLKETDDIGPAGSPHCPEAKDSARRLELHRGRAVVLNGVLKLRGD